jgi:YHS domain-containing protein
MGDPVVAESRSDPRLSSDYQGKRYTFCCEHCKPKFDDDPDSWIQDPAEPKDD